MPFLPLLAACQPEYVIDNYWEVEPPEIPLSELFAPCLPPDESLCPIDTTTARYNEDCVRDIAMMREDFARTVESALLPEGATYDEFVNGELPTTVYGHYFEPDYATLIFSYGDVRTGETPGAAPWHNDVPWPLESGRFARFECTTNYSDQYLTENNLFVYPLDAGYPDAKISSFYFWGIYDLSFNGPAVANSFYCMDDSSDCLATSAIARTKATAQDIIRTAQIVAPSEEMATDHWHGDMVYFYDNP